MESEYLIILKKMLYVDEKKLHDLYEKLLCTKLELPSYGQFFIGELQRYYNYIAHQYCLSQSPQDLERLAKIVNEIEVLSRKSINGM